MSPDLKDVVREAFEEHRDAVWGVCYRMLGSAAEADDQCQETYLRLQDKPPERLDDSLRGWLVTVAANLCRDRLRARDRTTYQGTWLPSPVEVRSDRGWFAGEIAREAHESPEHRARRMESVSYAFLVALETLSANQRAVLILRDVYDFSVRETARALSLTETNVKTTHHRARKRLDGEKDSIDWPATSDDARMELVGSLVRCLEREEFGKLAELLSDGVVLCSDGGDGEFIANTRQLDGVEHVGAFIRALALKSDIQRIRLVELNGMTALDVELTPVMERQAPRAIIHFCVSGRRIGAIYVVMASSKIGHLTV